MILETKRLMLRELAPSDAEQFYLLNNDPDVVRYTGDDPFGSIAEAEDFLRNYNAYKDNGYGRMAVIDKSNGEFLGWCGLKLNADGDTDIGFRFFKKHWNKGYATESARACIDYGFDVLNLKSIIGRAMVDNKASIHVLEKIGLSFEKEFDCHRHPGVLYRINRG